MHGREMQQEVQSIQTTLEAVIQEAQGLLHRLERPEQLSRFQESLQQKSLEFVVNLDMAMAGIHQARQNLLNLQMQMMATQN